MILEILIGAFIFYMLFKPRTKYVDTIPERFTPFKMSSVCDTMPDAYNTQRLYMNNPNIYPVFWNYDKALAYNKKKEFIYVQNQRANILQEYGRE